MQTVDTLLLIRMLYSVTYLLTSFFLFHFPSNLRSLVYRGTSTTQCIKWSKFVVNYFCLQSGLLYCGLRSSNFSRNGQYTIAASVCCCSTNLFIALRCRPMASSCHSLCCRACGDVSGTPRIFNALQSFSSLVTAESSSCLLLERRAVIKRSLGRQTSSSDGSRASSHV